MPIYEYTCAKCGHFFEALVRSSAKSDSPSCPDCASGKVVKELSIFSPSVASHLSAPPRCDTSGQCDTPNLPGCRSGACGLN
ncbi:hypothetical protein MNBD_NITROSPINAE02-2238 [hydrothermal vent metagenome]|uniref:Putative regulatory protein FmdB zinc ribbon domain-containing protein n=1 Tax=hydrothermal vent metagenome TaxID=652676 RepID=A0A3B1CBS6_9ZZZZ